MENKELWLVFLNSKMTEIKERAHDLACPLLATNLYGEDIAKINSFEGLKEKHKQILCEAEIMKMQPQR
jgi:hypothetical protein